jgi:8-oxo-dGTP pyrophosphatase MutT (NUDIX family)
MVLVSTKAAKADQYAALPFRRKRGGSVEIMLVTSRETRRWIIPKGWPIKGVTPGNLAALEAMEEAGLVGRISDQPVGSYRYDKKRSDGSIVTCSVDTFTLEVEQQMPTWPEKKQRETKWFDVDAAAKAVQEPELRAIIKKLRALIG